MEASPTGGNELAVPPLDVGQAFGQIYEVFLVLDSREQFRRDARGYVLISLCWLTVFCSTWNFNI
jgi:hypothetical protein